MQGLVEGRIDIGVMYTPQSRPGLQGRTAVRGAARAGLDRSEGEPEPQAGYVYVDWGPEFYAQHSACLPEFAGPALTANIGWLGLQHILENGGSGYFARRIVVPLLQAGGYTWWPGRRNSQCRLMSFIRSTGRTITCCAPSGSRIGLADVRVKRPVEAPAKKRGGRKPR